jgi:hypothetical protein
VLELQDGTMKNWQASTTHMNLHKTNTRWLMHNWNTFGVRTSHKQFRFTRLTTVQTWGSHHLPPYNIFYSSPWGPHLNGFLSWDSQVGISKFPQLGILWFWGLITSHADLWLRWGLKQSYNPRRELSNIMLHATCTWGNKVDSWLLVVGNQIANLTPNISFYHNLYFKCPNGRCKSILDIYISIVFQWYKKLFKAIGFDLCNHILKIRKSIGTPTPNMEFIWECEGSFLHTLWHSREHETWLLSFLLNLQPCKPLFWSWTQG